MNEENDFERQCFHGLNGFFISDAHNLTQLKNCSRLILINITTIITMTSHFRNNDNASDDSQAPPTSNLEGGLGAEGTEAGTAGATEADGTTPIDFETPSPHDLALNTAVSSTQHKLFETLQKIVTNEPNVLNLQGTGGGGPHIENDPSSSSGLVSFHAHGTFEKTSKAHATPSFILLHHYAY